MSLGDPYQSLGEGVEAFARQFPLFGAEVGAMTIEDAVGGAVGRFWFHSGQSESPHLFLQGW